MAEQKFTPPSRPQELETVRVERSRTHKRANRRRKEARAFRKSADGRAKALRAEAVYLGQNLEQFIEDDGEKRVLCGNIPREFI